MIPGQSVDLDRLVREEADRLDALTERQQDQQWVETTRELNMQRSNRAMAKALGCGLCVEPIADCATPAMCGIEKPA